MSTIGDLSTVSTVSSADKLPLWSNANSVTRAMPISVLDSRYITADSIALLAISPATEIFTAGDGIAPNTFVPGTTFSLTLKNQYYSGDNIEVHYDGTFQGPDQYTLVGLGLVFTSPIPDGVTNVYVHGGATRLTSAPAAGTVTDASVAPGSALASFIQYKVIDSIAALGALSVQQFKRAFVTGYYSAGDGGGGAYYYNAAIPSSSADGGSIIAASGGIGCWVLDFGGQLSVKQYGAKGDGTTDDTAACNAAQASAHVIWYPNGGYVATASINLVPNGGIEGESQNAYFLRKFNGAPVILYPGGNPITLKNFAVLCDASITVTSVDTGVSLGMAVNSSGRGEVANLLIMRQYHGFMWKAGGVNTISNVDCIANQGNGFFGEVANQVLDTCLSQLNNGDGYYFETSQNGQGQPQLRNCTSYANAAFGYNFTAQTGGFGANVWMSGCISSFDKIAGMLFTGTWTQLYLSDLLIEYAGQINVQRPDVAGFSTAIGFQIAGPCSGVFMNNVYVNTSNGIGMVLSGLSQATIGTLQIANSNQGGVGGGNAVGLNILGASSNVTFTGLVANSGGAQTVDISVSGSCTGIVFTNPNFRTYLTDNTSKVYFTGHNPSIASALSAGSASTVVWPDYTDALMITGTTTINNISMATAPFGRTVKMMFQSALTVANTGNIKLSAPFSATANSTLTLFTDGVNFYGK